jgi:hypothetical protein
MPLTPAALVRDHRDHFLRRKLVRSPLLQFLPGAYRVDVTSLFSGVLANAPAQDGAGVTTPSGFMRGLIESRQQAVVHNLPISLGVKLRKIGAEARDVQLSTGQHALYVGYPCILMPQAKGVPKFAPLFLYAVELDMSARKLVVKRSVDGDVVREPIFNKLLASYVLRENDIRLHGDYDSDALSPESHADSLANIFKDWPGLKIDWTYPNVSACPSREVRETYGSLDSDAVILDSAVLGLADFSGQALLDDLEKIATALDDGAVCSAPLRKLLEPRNYGEDAASKVPSDDLGKWLVEMSDPSQEAVVWAQRDAGLVVLQGPPGTGKSQTIVNTVADAVAARQNVLVVCQKRAAIDVVRKRFEGVGLGDLGVLIDDLNKDRTPVINRIRGIETNFAGTLFARENRVHASREIHELEAQIDRAMEDLHDDDNARAMRYRDLLAVLKNLEVFDRHADWSSALVRTVRDATNQWEHQSQLGILLQEAQLRDDVAKRLNYPRNAWSDVGAALAEDAPLLAEIQRALRTTARFLPELTSGALRPSGSPETHWLAHHPWVVKGDLAEGCLSVPCSDPKDRQSRQKFVEWLNAIRTLHSRNSNFDAEKHLRDLVTGKSNDEVISAFCKDGDLLGDLASFRKACSQNGVLAEADQSLRQHAGDWRRHIHALVVHTWLERLLERTTKTFHYTRRISDNRQQLKHALERKLAADKSDILGRHGDRLDAAETLKERDLLRLRGRSGIPKTSLRRLFTVGSDQISKVVPLVLTSPETASQLLALKPESHDLVVIDEASQMYVAEAIPMLYRAKRAVIAGDQMQMPPSDFFAFGEDEELDTEPETDVDDSVTVGIAAADGQYRLLEAAEEALGQNSPHRRKLNIHYRSARKELIDFSNHAFYEGGLQTPSGNSNLPPFLSSAIVLEEVGGTFSSRINEVEARRIVAWLRHIWRMPIDERPSVGVIVNNIKQKAKIEELLVDVSETDKVFGKVYDEERGRRINDEDASFFVRSVESVQGDERDIIIFGMTYSGDSRGFGPLTKSRDGRKRLNVAITRARRGMIVLSSLNLSHTSNLAERETHERYFVWQYLRYAQAVSKRDSEAINAILIQVNPARANPAVNPVETESPFEEDVMKYVTSLGYAVDTQVGEAGFRIDLGVKRNSSDLNYLCGLECDGAAYHSGWNARTRDIWRQGILESKGWNILRIWSTDWFEKADATKQQLRESLEELRRAETGDSAPSPMPKYVIPIFSGREAATAANEATKSNSRLTPTLPQTVAAHSKPEQIATQVSRHTRVAIPLPEIEIGDTVDYIDANGRKCSVRIVSGTSSPSDGTINAKTPLAVALLGAKENEIVSFLSPEGEKELNIVRVRQ